MKIVLALSVIILLGSCGKYERPFITFKSPEKRLTQTSWRCVKVVNEEGNEFEVFDQLDFSIDGSDSTFYRISEVGQFTSDYSGTRDTVQGNWTWAYALDGNFNKQLIKHTNPAKTLKIISLSSKVLVFQDYSNNNSVYHYAPL